MAIPDYQTLMLPVLQIAAQAETRVPDIAQTIADQYGLSEDEREEMLPSGRQRVLHNRINWAKFYMSKAGLIDTPRRGVFVASPEGHKLLATNPQRIDNALLWNYPSFVAFRTHTDQADKAGSVKTEQATETASTLESEPQSTLDETIDAAHTALTTTLKADLLQRILDQPPDFFERLIINLLVAMGYGGSHRDAARNLGKSGDGGVDGVIDQDRLGLDQIYVQAKRYTTGTIGRPDVQGFVGSLVGRSASKGVFVTTTSFSKQAHDYVENLPQRVILVDGGRLCELMIEHDVGARVDRTITIKRLDEDFFLEN